MHLQIPDKNASNKIIPISVLILLSIINLSNFSQFLVGTSDVFIYFYVASQNLLSLICHQQESKLFDFGNYHSLLCSRCTGIYFGAFMNGIVIMIFEIKKFRWTKFFYFSIFLMIADIIFYQLKFYDYSQIIAIATGLIFGITSIGILFMAIDILIKEFKGSE